MTQLDLAKTGKRRSYLRPSLLALTAFFGASAMTATSAHAEGVDPAQIQALQEQIKQLQSEIDGLVANQVKASKKISSITPAKGSVVVSSPGKGQLKIGGLTLSLGGYVEADGVYRSKAQQSDLNTALKGVPFNNAVGSRQSEFRETARATRLSIGLKGKADAHTTISAYVEGDFLGTSGTTANTGATNSFSPRLRQAWAGYERSDLGLHVFGGQSFSLVTQETLGMSPGKEAAFGWVDSASHAGYVNIRQPGLRVVKDFSNKYFLGVAFENPTVLPVGTAPVIGGTATTTTYAGAQTLGGVAAVSDDVAPDIIVKGAADTSFGHYEAFGIGRFLRARQNTSALVQGHNTIRTAIGGGVSAFDSIIPKKLDIQGNFIYGSGVARYSASQLGDVTYSKGGGLVLLPSIVAQVGLTGHVLPTLDVYGIAGLEMIHGGGSNSVYGNGASASNAGCYAFGGACGAQVKQVSEYTLGSWWSFYKGAAGTFQTGLQASYLRNVSFADAKGTAPHAGEELVFLSLRYSPFK